MTRATSYDVARLAGVSQSAVSRVFRPGASVSRDARARVEAAARALNYAPSQIARSLISRRSRMIGVIVTQLTMRNYPEALQMLGTEIQSSGNRMLVVMVPNDDGAAAAAADLLGYHVDGIVSSAFLPDETLEVCASHKAPVVLFNRTPRNALASSVCCDHADAMELLVAHLATAGIGRVAYVAGPERAPVSNDRLLGLRNALLARGKQIGRVVHSDYSYEGGRAVAAELAAGPEKPDLVVCANDAMGLGVMDGLRFDLNLRVPGDVAVAGFDDVLQSSWPTYGLTTLRQPLQRMAQAAMRMLMEQIGGQAGAGERRLLPAELKIRNSTAARVDSN